VYLKCPGCDYSIGFTSTTARRLTDRVPILVKATPRGRRDRPGLARARCDSSKAGR
jgi:hypothetical protein